jgi:hypothetical protein
VVKGRAETVISRSRFQTRIEWSARRSRRTIAWWLIQMIPIVRKETTKAA